MQTLQVNSIIENSIAKAMSYEEYIALMAKLMAEGASTSTVPSEEMTLFTKLNYKRMIRLNKTIKIDGKYKEVVDAYKKKVTWLVLTESWCGDAAQILPVVNKIAEMSGNISLRLVLRDENIDLMDLCLTNGTRSIPKLLVIDEDYNIIDSFGPRPEAALNLVDDFREQYGKLTPEFKQYLQLWYNKDRGKSIVKDLLKLMT
ncbi:thioredoxin family protein [Neptunitalea lumnitzerae]|uniref:Thioredoxin n=1 Tax=Neptunitalea lumnitzerae TaxID=2965509 RepID=A0ABQ5MGF7_9FLAO|nr:thioredoxin family protein [Neptunitalea sp. Y10]GLB48442.1 thioredoxin [Neptunitalea sp. Y10]